MQQLITYKITEYQVTWKFSLIHSLPLLHLLKFSLVCAQMHIIIWHKVFVHLNAFFFYCYFFCTDVKLESNVCISAIWKWLNFNLLKYIFYRINFLAYLVEKCVVINLGELWSLNVLQCYKNLYNCELFQCFRIFYLLIHACLSPACFDIIILKWLILQFHLGEFSITWEVCDVCIL